MIAVWHRRLATPTVGCPAGTWCSWSRTGSAHLEDADGASVLGFLESLSSRWARSSLFWVVSNFRPFLKFTGRVDLVEAVGLAGVKRSHTILPVLSDDDERLVVQACAAGAVSARDAAITLLALTTGLRACDIVGLRLSDIDWRSRTAEIVQQKTRNPLTVPLTALLVVKLADYVLDEQARLNRRTRVPALRGATHSTRRSRLDLPSDGGRVPHGRRRRRQGRVSAPASQRRVQAAARGSAAADDLGRAWPRERRVDEPVHERRSGASA